MIQFNAPEGFKSNDSVNGLSESEQAVLNLLIENPSYTITLLSQKLGLSKKTVYEKIKTLKEKGIIYRVGSDRNGYWKIKNKAKNYLEKNE